MVSYVSVGLAQLLGDFFKGKPFEEMQSKRFALVFRQRLEYFPPAISTEETFDGPVVLCAFIAAMVTFRWLVCDSGQIEPLGLQTPSPQKGLCVGDLDDPGACRAF